MEKIWPKSINKIDYIISKEGEEIQKEIKSMKVIKKLARDFKWVWKKILRVSKDTYLHFLHFFSLAMKPSPHLQTSRIYNFSLAKILFTGEVNLKEVCYSKIFVTDFKATVHIQQILLTNPEYMSNIL